MSDSQHGPAQEAGGPEDTAIDAGLNAAHSVLSLIYYRGYGDAAPLANRDDVDRALGALIAAEDAIARKRVELRRETERE